MGKGDRKSRKGKISMGSYGNTRPQKPKQLVMSKPEAKPTAKK
ncbi:30S ribosomal protein THX [Spirosoma gilvum]